jgi:diketogulonate reductase-like aldo/keto reductase
MHRAAFDLGLVEAVGVCNYKTSQLQQFHSLMLARDIPIASNQVPMLKLLLHCWDFCIC